MSALMSELMVFPLGKNDDLADALSMQLQMLDLTVVEDNAGQELVTYGFGVEQAVRSIAQRLRPEPGSVYDVAFQPSEENPDPDPYGYLDNPMTIEEYKDWRFGSKAQMN